MRVIELMSREEADKIERLACEAEYPPTNRVVLGRALITRALEGKDSPCIVGWLAYLAGLGLEAHEKAFEQHKGAV